MSKRIFIFPGQGSQSVGMGKNLADSFAEAREVFAEVDDALNHHLSKIIFTGPEDQLTQTENAQPALMAVSLAVVKVLEKQSGRSLDQMADFVAGHSLGEYSGLAAVRALSISDTARLLRARGLAMQRAVPAGEGAMAAIFPVETAVAAQLVAEASTEKNYCDLANDNGGGQMVVSGHVAAVERAMAAATARGIKRAVRLPVSAPFHCRLMAAAAAEMADRLADAAFVAPRLPVLANVTAAAVSDPSEIKRLLVTQITGMVRWRETVESFGSLGITQAVELGAGKVLAGLVKRINGEVATSSLSSPEDIDGFIARL
ncbi:MAG: ACP S-malonyltransferase [Candidatus Pacebacteria bacterium]|nr:ACP S-malonyltransferase [Candidatus Paceibacterota bacterium]